MVIASWSEMSVSEHFVQFCETDAFLVNSVSEFIGAGLMAGDVVIVFATKGHRERLDERLKEDGLVVSVAHARGQYVSMDAADTLSKFMVDGLPEPERFAKVVGSIVARAAQGGRHVRIFGELVALLWAEGNQTAAIRLEELWNDLARTHAFALFCAYPMQGFDGEVHGMEFTEICRQHSRVIPSESYTPLSSPDKRLRAITLLQQKANALEVEIAKRKRAEEALRESEARWRFLETQLNTLTKIINDLPDISKIQQGKLDYREDPFDLEALVQEIVENLQAVTATHQLLIEARAEVQIYSDRDCS